MAKVVLDAGHGGVEPGAVHEGRQEKDDTLRLTLAVGEILEDNGVEVVYTRTEDVYDTPLQKAQIANAEGGDFFISFHRNSSPEANQYSGVESLVYDLSGEKVALAEAINEELAEVGFRDLGVKERPDLIVLKRTQMPAVLVEVGFLNTDADNQLFDGQFAAIAEAIADGILSTLESGGYPGGNYGYNANSGSAVENNGTGNGSSGVNGGNTPKLYRVQTGAYRNRSYAEDLLYRLQQQNYPAFLLYEETPLRDAQRISRPEGEDASRRGQDAPPISMRYAQGGADDGLYKVQVGAFAQLDNAVRMEAALRRAGYSTFITTEA